MVWHVDSYSVTPAPFEERGLLGLGGVPAISSGSMGKDSTAVVIL